MSYYRDRLYETPTEGGKLVGALEQSILALELLQKRMLDCQEVCGEADKRVDSALDDLRKALKEILDE